MLRSTRTAYLATLVAFGGGGAFAQSCEEQNLEPINVNTGDTSRVGEAVSIHGDYLAIGAPKENQPTGLPFEANSGVVYVYVRDITAPIGERWSFQECLTANNPQAGDLFGQSVALDGTRLIAGSPTDDLPGGLTKAGSAYIFERSGNTWTRVAFLTHPSAAAQDQFGFSVDIDGTSSRAAVGAVFDGGGVGSVFVFERSGANWVQQAQVVAPDGQAGDNFGWSVAIEGDRLVVGANGADLGTETDAGAVYVFEWNSSTWQFEEKLSATTAQTDDQFGHSISLSGDSLVAGSPNFDITGASNVGRAYVFDYDGTNWAGSSIQASDESSNAAAQFGISVGMDATSIIVGTRESGSAEKAYLFKLNSGTWTQQLPILVSDNAESNAEVGWSVSISNDVAAVGAPGDKNQANNSSGTAFVFAPPDDLVITYCTAKTAHLGAACTPFISTSGTASMTDTGSFMVVANNAPVYELDPIPSGLQSSSGKLMYSLSGRASANWNGGLRCIKNPLIRVSDLMFEVQQGTNDVGTCLGALPFNMNSLIQAGSDPALMIGTTVRMQWTLTDPGNTFDTGITDAVEFVICP